MVLENALHSRALKIQQNVHDKQQVDQWKTTKKK